MCGADAVLRSLMYVILSAYYVLAVHMNPLQLVLAGTMLEVSYFLFQIPTGLLADHYSRRFAVVLGWSIVGVCFMGEGLLPSVTAILAFQAVLGLGEAFIEGAQTAWVAEEVGDAEFGPLTVRGGQISQFGGMAGTLAGALLAGIRLNLPVVLGGVLMLGCGLLLAIIMPELHFTPRRRGEDESHLRAMGSSLRHSLRLVRGRPVLVAILLTMVFSGAASEGFDRLWQAHLLRDIHLPHLGTLQPVTWFGIISIASGIVGIVVSQWLHRRLDRITRDHVSTARFLMVTNIAFILSTVLFALAGSFALAFAALLGRAATGTLREAVQRIWFNQNVPDSSLRATVLSVGAGADALGQFSGGPALGIIGTVFSLRAAITSAACVLSPILLLYAWVTRQSVEDDAPAEAVAM